MEVEENEEHSLIIDDLATNTSELSLFPSNSLVNSFNLNAATNSHGGATANKLPSRGVLDGGDLKQESIADGNGKFRVLQRPLPMMGGPLSGRYMPERVTQEAPDTSLVARPRAGHRKKTLSLNPEEREALENLVEEVLIGGFEEAAVDSDSNSDDDEQVRASGATATDSPVGKRMGNVRTDTTNAHVDKNKEKNDNKNGKPADQKIGGYASKVMSNRERERQFAREFGRNIGPRNSPKEFVMPSGGSGGGGSQTVAGGGRDFGRRKDNNGVGGGSGGGSGSGGLRMKDGRSKSGDFRQPGGDYGGNRAAPVDHRGHEFRQSGGGDYRQQPSLGSGGGGNPSEFRNQSGGGEFRNSGDVRQQQSTDFKTNKSPGSGSGNVAGDLSSSYDAMEDKDKLGGVRGVNIYPAQLKVAIKHMDSLPPRFLRRLQSGNLRAGGVGSLEADQMLLSRMEPTILESPSKIEDSPTTSAEKERGAKSKQTQLQETKKSIRNLLGDLDQYTDEGVIMTPVSKDAGILFPGNLGARSIPPPTHGGYGGGAAQGNVLYRPPDSMGETGGSSMLFYGGPQQAGGAGGAPLNHPPPLPTTRQRVLSCEELEKELLHSGGGMMHSGGGLGRAPPPPTASQQYPVELMARGFHSMPPPSGAGGNEFYGSGGGQMMPPAGQGSMLPYQHTTTSATAASSASSKKTKFSVNAPEFISNRFSSGNVTNQHMTTENSEMLPPYYQQAPMGMIGGGQQHQFNAGGPPPPNSLMMQQSSEFINIPSGGGGASRSSMQSPYQLMSYDPSSMGMMRNSPMTPAYMSNPSGGGGPVNMMPYHPRHAPPPNPQYAQPPPSYGHSSAGYGGAPHPQFTPTQFTPPQFTPPPPSFLQPNMVAGGGPPMRWMVDTSSQRGANPPPPPLGPWYPPAPGMVGYGGGSMYVRNNIPDQQGIVMAPDDGGAYVMVDPALETGAAGDHVGSMMGGGVVENGWGGPPYDGGMSSPYEAGRQKVLRLLSEGNCVMVILIGGGPDVEKMNLVSELQTQSSGALVLNMRNGLVNGNASKLTEIQDWNYKQAVEAVETRKSPVIIDYVYEQDWEINDYINLGQQHGYMVEVIDANEHARQFAENELNCQYDGYQIQQQPGMYATGHQMAANDVYVTHQAANNGGGMYQTDMTMNAGRYPVHPIAQEEIPSDHAGAPQSNL